MNPTELINSINTDLALQLPGKISLEEIKSQLSQKINSLIKSDFQKLIYLLYRIDISETKLKNLLKENTGADAGTIIAELIIERQQQKIKSRQQFNHQDNNIDENEKW